MDVWILSRHRYDLVGLGSSPAARDPEDASNSRIAFHEMSVDPCMTMATRMSVGHMSSDEGLVMRVAQVMGPIFGLGQWV